MRRLKAHPGHPRTPRSTACTDALERWVEREARRFDVSKSFVIATCISVVSGIKEEDYRGAENTLRRIVRGRLMPFAKRA